MKFIIVYYVMYSLHFLLQSFNLSNIYIHFLNVGQGDSIFIRSPTTFGLIDGGPDYSLDYTLDNNMPFFNCKFTYILATHPHKDHIEGLNRVLKRCSVKNVLINYVPYKSKAWTEFLTQSKKISSVYTYPNLPAHLSSDYHADYFAINATKCTNDVNVCSLIIKLQLGVTSLLLTGDIYATYLESMELGHIDIFKVPHHGGKNTVSVSLLTKLDPSIAVISYGAKNKYGHPADQTTALLHKFNVKTLHTLHGDVLVKVTR